MGYGVRTLGLDLGQVQKRGGIIFFCWPYFSLRILVAPFLQSIKDTRQNIFRLINYKTKYYSVNDAPTLSMGDTQHVGWTRILFCQRRTNIVHGRYPSEQHWEPVIVKHKKSVRRWQNNIRVHPTSLMGFVCLDL
jgi:hypothetical protein